MCPEPSIPEADYLRAGTNTPERSVCRPESAIYVAHKTSALAVLTLCER